jgi:hypothetical protein
MYNFHTHIVGVGDTGAYVNPEMRSYFHPIKRLTFSAYKSRAKIVDEKKADQQYIERLVDLI